MTHRLTYLPGVPAKSSPSSQPVSLSAKSAFLRLLLLRYFHTSAPSPACAGDISDSDNQPSELCPRATCMLAPPPKLWAGLE